ncbi:hypothetical protein PMAYCL1PPCAC_32399 [Pristionchus mayeri]|uniref:Uncharacterized protein n=1 Tax=Pristionchus mayeri TaxID=1317129 RepID=A0AAN5IEZ3_9BILA|nr:hypothetical protein PMAYCL1PPCAC_32399 [Pristionchus mayeri]
MFITVFEPCIRERRFGVIEHRSKNHQYISNVTFRNDVYNKRTINAFDMSLRVFGPARKNLGTRTRAVRSVRSIDASADAANVRARNFRRAATNTGLISTLRSGHALSLVVQIESARALALGRTAHHDAGTGFVLSTLRGTYRGALGEDLVLLALTLCRSEYCEHG